MTDAGRHPNINVLTQSEVKSVTGYIGNFEVSVVKKAKYVQEDECNACGDCAEIPDQRISHRTHVMSELAKASASAAFSSSSLLSTFSCILLSRPSIPSFLIISA